MRDGEHNIQLLVVGSLWQAGYGPRFIIHTETV